MSPARPALLLLFVLGAMGATAADAPGRPNIILVLADDLGYGDLGCYGQKQVRTPNIDRLAAEGMRFTDFYAGSTVCAPSRCVLMTGWHTGHALIRGNSKNSIRPEDVTVAEVLKRAGYATGLFGKWGLGQEGSTGMPTRQGFDDFYGYLDQGHAHNYYPTFLVRQEERVKLRNVVPKEGRSGQGVATEKVEYSADLILAEALSFIDARKGGPFFLFFSSTLPHANNEAGRKGMEIPSHGIYANRDWPEPQKGLAAMIGHLDMAVGKILERLERHGIDDDTLILFSSDNGPHREGGNNPDFFDSNGALRGIKRDLYEGGIRVPGIARWPAKVKAGAVTDHVASFADFLPTAADMAGVAVEYPLDGISFLPTLLGKPELQQAHPYLYWEFHERGFAQAVRMGRWKAVAKRRAGGAVELYDLENDLGEKNDVAAAHPEIVARMRKILEEARTESAWWPVEKEKKLKKKRQQE